MPFNSCNHPEYFVLHFHKSRYILSLTCGRRLEKFLNSSCMIVNQYRLMRASPAFKIDQKIHSMLVKHNCKNQFVFCCNIFGNKIVTYQETILTTVLTECKVGVKRKEKLILTGKFYFSKKAASSLFTFSVLTE